MGGAVTMGNMVSCRLNTWSLHLVRQPAILTRLILWSDISYCGYLNRHPNGSISESSDSSATVPNFRQNYLNMEMAKKKKKMRFSVKSHLVDQSTMYLVSLECSLKMLFQNGVHSMLIS